MAKRRRKLKKKYAKTRAVTLLPSMDPERVVAALRDRGYRARSAVVTNAPSAALKGYKKNSSGTPTWLVPAIVVSGIVSIFLWKKANPGASLNPTV